MLAVPYFGGVSFLYCVLESVNLPDAFRDYSSRDGQTMGPCKVPVRRNRPVEEAYDARGKIRTTGQRAPAQKDGGTNVV